MEKICWQITVAAFMQPLQYDLRDPAAKDNSITNCQPQHEATLTQPFTLRERSLQLQSTMEFHRQLIHQHHLQSHLHCGNDPRVANHNGIPSATHPPAPLAIPFTLLGTVLQLPITMEFCRRQMHEKHLKPHLQCGTDPRPIRPWSEHDPTTRARDRLAPVAPQR